MKNNRKIYVLIAVIGVLALVAGIGYAARDKLPPGVAAWFGTKKAPSGSGKTESPAVVASMLKGKPLDGGNVSKYGVKQVAYADVAETDYSVSVVTGINNPDRMIVLLILNQAVIMDAGETPSFNISGAAVASLDARVPCKWHDSPVVAVIDGAVDSPKNVISGWRFDFAKGQMDAVPPFEVDCKEYIADAAHTRHYEELTGDGWGGEAVHGFEGIHDLKEFQRIGTVVKDDVELVKREDDPSVNDEIHNFQYDGMQAQVYLARYDHKEKIMVNDVEISSPNWRVKYGLNVGAPKKKVEEALGVGLSVNGDPHVVLYGEEQGAEVTFTYDGDDKVKSIRWHMEEQ